MKTIAIIPARGGSKRIPGKNIKLFCGKPVIAYIINAALNSRLFEEVIVSTDDSEIAGISAKHGAKVPFMRSPENSNDFAGTADVLMEVMQWYRENGKQYTHACCLYPAAVFVNPAQLIASYQKFTAGNFDSLFPVAHYSYPVQRAIKMDTDGKIAWAMPEHAGARSQDLAPMYHDCGQYYWFKTDPLLKSRSLFTSNTGSVVLGEMEYHDIDTEEDWKIAEFKYNYINR